MATIEDVAALAGVSVATVSRVMNNSYVVSEEKRKRVLQAAQTLDYRPPSYGRGQKKSVNKTILVICSVVIYEVIAGIQAMAKELGYEVLIHYSADYNADLSTVGILKNKMVDGVIMLNMLLDNDALSSISSRFPVVQCSEYVNLKNAYQVTVDNEGGAHAVVSHLIESAGNGSRMFCPRLSMEHPIRPSSPPRLPTRP